MAYRISLFIILVVCSSGRSFAQIDTSGFCAVELHVEWPFGPDTSAIIAKLIDSSASVVAEAPVVEGKAEFCDFGFGLHAIVIEARGFHSVRIDSVRLVMGSKQSFRVVLNRKLSFQARGGTACGVYVRVVSTDGTAISFARLRLLDSDENFFADQHGRAYFGVPVGSSSSLIANVQGYREGSAEFKCSEASRLEHLLTLEVDSK